MRSKLYLQCAELFYSLFSLLIATGPAGPNKVVLVSEIVGSAGALNKAGSVLPISKGLFPASFGIGENSGGFNIMQ